jgi:ABC-type maltose transport system permease subunit
VEKMIYREKKDLIYREMIFFMFAATVFLVAAYILIDLVR